MTRVLALFSTRAFRRFATWLLLGFCLALWPLAGYAATFWVSAPAHDVASPAQAGLVVTKSAGAAQASVGDTITYSYRVTNSGTLPLLAITAVDDQLGVVTGLAGALGVGASRSAILTYVVQLSDVGAPLVNTVVVTGTVAETGSVTGSASATVTILDPTALPGTEQPDQPQTTIFMPSIMP